MTYQNLLRQALIPYAESRLLLGFLTKKPLSFFMAHSEDLMPTDILEAYELLLKRRLAGEPMAYLLGSKEFYGREFQINSSVLIPRPETEHLIDLSLSLLKSKCQTTPSDVLHVLDLGTGSGAIGLTLALELPQANVYASDFSESALAVAKNNAKNLRANVNFLEGSWLQPWAQHHPNLQFDLIVSNPPYIEKNDPHLLQGDLRFEPQHALSDNANGLSCLQAIAKQAPKHLQKGGFLLLEHGYDQGVACRDLLREAGFDAVQTQADYANLERITWGVWRSFH
ncbi:MAG: peptide chain release factor N(5)-glutamine methyltransferase [Neisseriaceae bacterium]|nr:peptide chain release factor N(5)-glutamine methyltransferase [Neisseriaceae bacterium]